MTSTIVKMALGRVSRPESQLEVSGKREPGGKLPSWFLPLDEPRALERAHACGYLGAEADSSEDTA